MKNWIVRWIANIVALFAVTLFVPGIRFDGQHYLSLVVVVVGLALANAVIRPVIMFFAWPINCLTFGLLGGQEVFTVGTMRAKLEAQVRGIGGGFLPECMASSDIAAGRLVVKNTERGKRVVRVHYAWRGASRARQGRALQWWLKQLESATTRAALLAQYQRG